MYYYFYTLWVFKIVMLLFKSFVEKRVKMKKSNESVLHILKRDNFSILLVILGCIDY